MPAIEIEKRIFAARDLKIELRSDGKGNVMRGHAAVFDKPSEDLGGFVEYVRKGCFARAIQQKQDVRALIDHESRLVLGRTASQTLQIREDGDGLYVECDLPDTSYVRDLKVSMDRGDISQMSFGFRTVKDSWNYKAAPMTRDLLDVDLFDVSVVTYPAYPDATCALRSLDAARAAGKLQDLSHPLEDPAVARMMGDLRR